MPKKAQGLSINTVVAAAILLCVLLVLSIMFIIQMRGYEQTLSECESQGGKCTLERFCRGPHLNSDCGELVDEGPLGPGGLSWVILSRDVVCCLKVKQ
jgi:hypothetical protein